MNFRQVIQAGPGKANELFAKLSETSDSAAKTREKLFGELKAELELHADLEERHLLPILRKHKETKDLVPETTRDNKELRAGLAELERLPKDDPTFLPKLSELRKGVQRHVRDDKKELLPAVLKALSEDEAQAVAEQIETGLAEAEQAKRDQAEQRRADAKHERERAEQEAAERDAAERARTAADRRTRETVREAAASAERTAEAARNGARRLAETVADQAQRSAAAVLDTAEVYRSSTQDTAGDLQAVAAFSNIAVGGMAEIRSAWMEWAGTAVSAGARASQQLMRCRTVQQVAETQREFFADAMRRWMAGNVRVLQISRRMAEDALRPLEERLEAGAERRRSSR